MEDIEFYVRLINCPCDGCSAYEEIGHCGTWLENCLIYDLLIGLDELLEWLGWDKEEFIDFIIFKDKLETEFFKLEFDFYEEMLTDPDFLELQDPDFLT